MVEKNIEIGVFGKCDKNKAGDYFVKIMKEGGAVVTVKARHVEGQNRFPEMVRVEMHNCEQKFSNYGDSFWAAETVKIGPVVQVAKAVGQ